MSGDRSQQRDWQTVGTRFVQVWLKGDSGGQKYRNSNEIKRERPNNEEEKERDKAFLRANPQ